LAPNVALHWVPVTPSTFVVPEIRLVPPVVVVTPEPIAVPVDVAAAQIKFTQLLLRQSVFTAHAAPLIFPQLELVPATRVLEPVGPTLSRLPKVPPPPFVLPTMACEVGVAVVPVVVVPASEE